MHSHISDCFIQSDLRGWTICFIKWIIVLLYVVVLHCDLQLHIVIYRSRMLFVCACRVLNRQITLALFVGMGWSLAQPSMCVTCSSALVSLWWVLTCLQHLLSPHWWIIYPKLLWKQWLSLAYFVDIAFSVQISLPAECHPEDEYN